MSKRQTNPVTRNYLKTNRKRAIDAMCAHCFGVTSSLQGNGLIDHLEAGFRASIRECASTHCPLHTWRPFQPTKAHQAESEHG